MEHKSIAYPIATDHKLPWLSHADLGNYIAKAIVKPELAGETFPIGGNLVSGNEIAEAIALQLGQELQFVSIPVDAFEQQLQPGFGDIAAKEISNLYRFVAEHRTEFVNKDFQTTNLRLGVSPQSVTAWAESVDWTVA